MKKTSLMFFLFAIALSAIAQTRELKKVLELKIPREGGANGAAVAWHPVQKKYYAAMAGNTDFFLGCYDVKGNLLSPIEQKAMFDIRGLWYNPSTKTLQMNGYNDFGWGEYKLDAKGFPVSVKTIFDEMRQPDAQSVGALNPSNQKIYFFNGEGEIEIYNLKDGIYEEKMTLTLGLSADDEPETENADVIDDYNSNGLVFTGLPKAELGLLNCSTNEVELYDLKTGHLNRRLSFPIEAPVNCFLNFSYCNGIYWLFDKTKRVWIGYK